jgi:hypothetical protein
MRYLVASLLVLINSLSFAQNINQSNIMLEKMYQMGAVNERLFDEESVLMIDYQPTIIGAFAIKSYIDSLLTHNTFSDIRFKSLETYLYKDVVIDIGNLEWERNNNRERGKYWNVWKLIEKDVYVLQSHSFGFYHKAISPELLRFQIETDSFNTPIQDNFELMAYNALMEKAVKKRDGVLRAEFFTEDASFFPFEETPKITKKVLLPYLIQYNSGDVTIKEINVFTIDYEKLEDGFIEYNGFNVNWQAGNFQGKTKGKGIRIWKRQADGSLKIFREIGLHDL